MFSRKLTETLFKDKIVQDQDKTNSERSNEQSLKKKSCQSPFEISCLCFKGVASSKLAFLEAFEKWLKTRSLSGVATENGAI